MQQRLTNLGYWLGTVDGSWGYLTTQAVYAVQKAAGLSRDGIAGPMTRRAIANGVVPRPRVGGTAIEVDLQRQLLLIVRGGRLVAIHNASTGSNIPYTEMYKGRVYHGSARTPRGTYSVYRQVDANDVGPLGALWRPKYFNGGIAVHGSSSVPPYNASHGCVRIANAAMDRIWANGWMPIGTTVVVY